MSTTNQLPPFLKPNDLTVKLPTKTNSILNFPPNTIAADAQATHILVHPRYPALLTSFLAHKRTNGSVHEKALYATLTWQQLAARFIQARPLTFMGPRDSTMLRDGTMLTSAAHLEWDRNGTDAQHLNSHITLANYLSYDEIMLSSLLGVSGPSFFINTGSRYNRAIPSPSDKDNNPSHEPRGIIIGLVGPRFERPHRMDSIHILPPPTPTEENIPQPPQDPAVTSLIQTFLNVPRDLSSDFDIPTYKSRIRITAETFLLEANARAASSNLKARAYVVGLGLGVWQHYHQQREWYVETFTSVLEDLELPSISTVEFAYIDNLPANVTESAIAIGASKGIRVLFSRRDPAEKLLPASDDGKDELLVLSYAWDGNAFPGNEYWTGSLCGSGDPAAACMSTVAELHNPLVNTEFVGRMKVAGREGYA